MKRHAPILALVLALATLSAAEAESLEEGEGDAAATAPGETGAESLAVDAFESAADDSQAPEETDEAAGFGFDGLDGESKVLAWSGFIEPEMRFLIDPERRGWTNSMKPDARLELKVFPTPQVDGAIVGDLDFDFADRVPPVVRGDLREMWVRFFSGPLTVNLGRQIHSWGSILEFGVIDILNPQELADLAQDQTDRKMGVFTAKGTWDFGFMQASGYVLPWFAPHDLPLTGAFGDSEGRMRPLQRAIEADARRRIAAATGDLAGDAYLEQLAETRARLEAALGEPVREVPSGTFGGSEVAAQLYFPTAAGDFVAGVARLYDRVGSLRLVAPDDLLALPHLAIIHPKFTAYTLAGAVPVGDFALRFEGLYLHTADPGGSNPFIRNPTLQSAAQIAWSPGDWEFRAGIQDEQIFALNDKAERADEYSIPSPAGSVLLLIAPRLAHAAATYRFGDAMHQLTLAYLVTYESNGHFVAPEADMGLVEGVRLRAGAQIYLGGREDSRGLDKPGFGQLDDLDNVYASLRVAF